MVTNRNNDIFFELTPKTNNYTKIESISIVEKFEWDNDVKFSVDSFNQLYAWNEMFDENEFKSRIKNNNRFFIFKENKNIVGHVWHSSDLILFNPTRKIKKLNKGILFAYNVFVNKNLHSKLFDSSQYYCAAANKLFLEGNNKVIVSIDSWNKASLNFAKRIGFIEKNFDI